MSGKGGVGRSTVAAALGLAAARYGKRTCVVQLNTRDELGRIFGVDASGYAPVPLRAGLPLFGCNLRPADALREYGQMKLHFRTLHKLVFENDVMQRLLRMIPGMNELVLLGKAWHMEAVERAADGRPAWDLLVIDAPATGHGVSLLRLPQTILAAVPVGPMADDARLMQALLQDPQRTALHVVTLPQDLPATEALELCEQAQTHLGIPTGHLIVNRVLPPLAEEKQLRALERVQPGTPLLADALANVAAYGHWHAEQAVQIRRLQRQSPLPVLLLPHLFGAIDAAALVGLADGIVLGMEASTLRAKRVGAGS